jgi:aspartyl-tRNA(Asn)/glutamyl-tRNA(Gln) amidotransferase subunit B
MNFWHQLEPPLTHYKNLINHLRASMPELPDTMVAMLTAEYGLSTKDAGTLLSLDDGHRLDYFFDVMARLQEFELGETDQAHLGRITGNWYVASLALANHMLIDYRVLMELGGLSKDVDFDPLRVTASELASIVSHVQQKNITSRSAKKLLLMKFEGAASSIEEIIEAEGMVLKPLSEEEYIALAQKLLEEKPDMVKDIKEKKQEKKVKWFVGQMMAKSAEGSVEPDVAEKVLREQLGLVEATS